MPKRLNRLKNRRMIWCTLINAGQRLLVFFVVCAVLLAMVARQPARKAGWVLRSYSKI